MKTTTTINLDVEVYAKARQKVQNLSEFVNNALKTHLKVTESSDFASNDAQTLKETIHRKTAEIAMLHKALKKREEKEENEEEVVYSG